MNDQLAQFDSMFGSGDAQPPANDHLKKFDEMFGSESKPQQWKPNQKDLRADGSQKGPGFLGTLQRPDGKISTELSIGVNMDGKETEIPSLVPTLTEEEKKHMLSGAKPTPEIIQKAVDHAKMRRDSGKPVFATEQDNQPIDKNSLAKFDAIASNPENHSPAYKLADKFTEHAPNQVFIEAAASGVPKDQQDNFLQALHELASQKRASQQHGTFAKALIGMSNAAIGQASSIVGATGIADKADAGGTPEEQKKFAKRVKQVWENADPLENKDPAWYDPRNAVIRAAKMAPSLGTAAAAGGLSSEAATALGAGAKAAGVAGEVGAAASFSPGMYEDTYDNLLEQGVAPSTARWSAAASAALKSAMMVGLTSKLLPKGISKEAFASKSAADAAYKFVTTAAGHGPGVLAAQQATDSFFEDMAKGKSPEFKKYLEDAKNGYLENVKTMGVMAIPGAVGDLASPETKNITPAQVKQERVNNEIIKTAGDGNIPSRAQWKDWGLPGGRSKEDRFAASQKIYNELKGQPEAPAKPAPKLAENVPEQYGVTQDFVDKMKSDSTQLKQPTGDNLN